MQKALIQLYKKDKIFKLIVNQYGIPEIPVRPPGFETLALLILEQQVSINSAKATFTKLKNIVEKFTPQMLFNLADETYRVAGVSRQKTTYIKALSNAILNKEIDIESLAKKNAIEVREALIKIKGIGNWTIDVYLMFCLQAEDVLPLGDVAVVNTIKELLNIHERNEMEIYTSKWSPHRSAATFLLWHYYLGKRNRKVDY